MLPWERRPREEANLFNPAFCGALIFEFVKEYQSARRKASPFVLPFCALPIALHPVTRAALPLSTRNSLYSWLEEHTDTLVGLGERARNLTPYIEEALRFAVDHGAIAIDEKGELLSRERIASFTSKKMEPMTLEVKECVNKTRFLGRWFAAAGSPSTILSSWGLRP